MVNPRRTFRMAEQIREFVAWELQRAADPRFALVTVTSVVLTADMGIAKVYWVVNGGKPKIEEAKQAFVAAEGLFRKAVSRGLKIRYIPELKFFYDDTFDISDGVERLLGKAFASENMEKEGDLQVQEEQE